VITLESSPEGRLRCRFGDEGVLLERAAELAAVDGVLASCDRGGGQLFVVEGPPGIGKTSILAQARARAQEAGAEVLHARASELERTFSYGIVRQLFEPLIRRADATERERLFEGAAAHCARLFEPRYMDREAATEDEAFALAHGLYWLAVNVAEVRPLVLAIDDLQWADAASLRWLSYLAHRLEGIFVCAFATVREGEVEDPVLAELLVDPATTIARPPPLTASSVAELVRASLGATAEEEFCAACHHATGGNPLLLHELVRTLASDGAAPTADAIELVERITPEAVARSVNVRLSRLPAEASRLAHAIAVLGDDAGGEEVAQLAGIDPRALPAAAAALARGHLSHRDEPLRFVHPVVRNAVYASIPAGERSSAHARAAAVLADARAAPEAVAAQLLNAPPGAVEGAAPVLREAARCAAAAGSPESTATYLRRCLEESLPDQARADALVELARAEHRLGLRTALQRLADAMALTDAPRFRSSAQLQLASYQRGWRLEEETVRTLEAALAERTDEDDDQAYRLEAELLSATIHNPERAEAVSARLASLTLDTSDGLGASLLRGVHAYQDAVRGTNRERAIATAERAAVGLRQHMGELDWSFAAGQTLHTLLLGDALAAASQYIEDIEVDARRSGDALASSSALLWRAQLDIATGAIADAEADARLAFDTRPAENIETPWLFAVLAAVLVERGALDEAARVLARFVAEVDTFREEDLQHAGLFRARASVHSARGDHGSALADALAAGRIARRFGFGNPAVDAGLMWRSEAALARYALGEEHSARELAQEQLELARRWGAPRTLGQALRILGLVDGGGQGIERLHEAVAVLKPSAARLEYAYALTDLGAALRRDNQRAAAREPLRLALDLAQRGGATLLAARAHEELIATGARPRRLLASGVDGLTPTERRVATLAAEGLSNREIAQSLFVTLRTVETHLSSVFRKLDLSSRTQLSPVLAGARDAAVEISGDSGAEHRGDAVCAAAAFDHR
jgi:DNA-binding CsgD family transcriptional regulator